MKKHNLLYLLVFVLIAALVIGGCAGPAAAPKEGEAIELKFTSGSPFIAGLGAVVLTPWAKEIEKRTAAIGKPVKITLYGLQALAKFQDTYDAVIKGIADVGAPWGPQHFPGRMPLLEVLQLPVLCESSTVACQLGQELYDTRPEIQEEMKETKLLFFCSTPPVAIHSRTKQIKTLDDFKGMKITARPGYTSFLVEALGGIPVTMSPPEAYQAAERGVVDAIMFNWDGTIVFKYFEVTKYRTVTPIGLYTDPLICSMNLDTWNNLPPEVQEIFDELSGMPQSTLAGNTFDASEEELKNQVLEIDQKAGNPPLYMIPDDEFQKWLSVITPLYDRWTSETEAKGLPAKSILDDAMKIAEKCSK